MNLFALDPQHMAALPYSAAWDFQSARALQVATKLDLFTALAAEPRSADALAEALGTDPGMTERMLIVLSALDLVLHDEGRWRNRLAAQLYLVAGAPLFQGHAIASAAALWDFYTDLETIMREGESEARWEQMRAARLQSSADIQETMVRAMHELALAGQAQHLVRVATMMAGRRTLLDVGAGPGTFSIAFCQRYPHLRAILWDQAETVAVARRVVAEFDIGNRINFRPGTWEDEAFGAPHSHDAVLLSNVIYGSETSATMTLLKAYEVLEPGGLLVIQDFMLDNDLCGPLPAALLNLRRPVFTIEQILAVVHETGFEQVTMLSPGTNQRNAIVMGIKPREGSPEMTLQEEAVTPTVELTIERPIPTTSLSMPGDAVTYTN